MHNAIHKSKIKKKKTNLRLFEDGICVIADSQRTPGERVDIVIKQIGRPVFSVGLKVAWIALLLRLAACRLQQR